MFWVGVVVVGVVVPVALTVLACVKATKVEGVSVIANPKS